jgi:hypothetical protein
MNPKKQKIKISMLVTLLLALFLNASAQSIKAETDTIGSAIITSLTTCFGSSKSVVFINVHENESTSVKAAISVLKGQGKYCLTQLKSKNDRYITFEYRGKNFKFDPNRIFSELGVSETIKRNSPHYQASFYNTPIQMVSDFGNNIVSKYINNKKLVVALHNNKPDAAIDINSYRKGGTEVEAVADTSVNPLEDKDDFFLTTDTSAFKFLKAKKYNVVLQDNLKAKDDGSLSVYAGKKNIPYINIEAEHGKIDKQIQMIKDVLEFLKSIE